MTMRARMSSKGQLVLPKQLREKKGLVEGSEVEVEDVAGGVLLRLMGGAKQASLDDLLGCVSFAGSPRTLADMEAAIRKGARARR